RHAGPRVHRRRPVPAAVPRAQGEALRAGVPVVPAARAAGPVEPSVARARIPHRDAGRAARVRRAVRRRRVGRCRPGGVGDAHLGRLGMGRGRTGGAPLGRSARRVREHRELHRGAARVRRAQARRAGHPAVSLSEEAMSITVLGVSHRTAPLEVRERFAHEPREVPASLARVLVAGAGGGVLLSTCNRTEFYLAEGDDAVPEVVGAARIFTRLAGRSALILGAGDMAELAATCLVSEGVRVTLVANRTYERARAIAEQLGARALTLDEAWEHFADADIVLSSTAAPHAVVTWDRVAPAV